MGRNVQLPAVHVYSQRGARGVRGAVFRDIGFGWVCSMTAGRRRPPQDTICGNILGISKVRGRCCA